MSEAKRHPFDVEALNKGDTISAAEIEAAYGISREDKRYGLRLQQAKSFIERQAFVHRGELWTIHSVKDQLHICTDAEALEYNEHAFEAGFNRMKASHIRTLAIDVTQLDAEDRQILERCQHSQSVQLQAIKNSRRQLRLAPHTRTTPSIGETSQ